MPTLQNGQTHSNNLSAKADEMIDCVWPFYEVSVYMVNDNLTL